MVQIQIDSHATNTDWFAWYKYRL